MIASLDKSDYIKKKKEKKRKEKKRKEKKKKRKEREVYFWVLKNVWAIDYYGMVCVCSNNISLKYEGTDYLVGIGVAKYIFKPFSDNLVWQTPCSSKHTCKKKEKLYISKMIMITMITIKINWINPY